MAVEKHLAVVAFVNGQARVLVGVGRTLACPAFAVTPSVERGRYLGSGHALASEIIEFTTWMRALISPTMRVQVLLGY